MKDIVIIESPFKGESFAERTEESYQLLQENKAYAQQALKHSLDEGEAPFASHLLYTQVLDDKDVGERRKGIETGWSFLKRADLMAVYDDLGISSGMRMSIAKAKEFGITIEYRSILKKSDIDVEETLRNSSCPVCNSVLELTSPDAHFVACADWHCASGPHCETPLEALLRWEKMVGTRIDREYKSEAK